MTIVIEGDASESLVEDLQVLCDKYDIEVHVEDE